MTKFQVLGVAMTDMSVRDSMRKVETYLHDGRVSAICYLTAGGLLEAESHPETKLFLEDMDLTIPADVETLRAAGITSRSRVKEVKGNDFLRAFLQRVLRSGAGIIVLSDTHDNLEVLEKGILGIQKGLNIIGRFALEDSSDEDGLINDINVLAPSVIISSLTYPKREEFFSMHHMKLHAEVWLMIQRSMALKSSRTGLLEKITAFLDSRALEKSVNQYNKEEPPAENEENETLIEPADESPDINEEVLKFDTKEIDTEAVRKGLGE